MDIDPDREWYYSITIHGVDRNEHHIRGVTNQGMCTTREQLTNCIVHAYTGWEWVRALSVHQLERNDL